jgi:hypothetical protein
MIETGMESLANHGPHSGVLLERRSGVEGSNEQIFGTDKQGRSWGQCD